jgi:hypothetical protein
MYAKLIGEEIRKAFLVDGAEPCTAGLSQKERPISTRNIDRV